MNIIKRITRLFKADMHGILDTLEEPEVILKQAVREMEAEIEQSRMHLKTLEKQQDRLEKKEAEMVINLQELEQQILFCFTQNNEVLAKSRIRKKLEINRFNQNLANNKQVLIDEKRELEKELAERQEKLKSIIDKLDLLTDQNPADWTDSVHERDDSINSGVVTQEDVEMAFLHEQQQWTMAAARNTTGE